MHAGVSYSLKEVLLWTRRNIYRLLIISAVPTALYYFLHWTWIGLPWTVVALLGTVTAFIVGFRNSQTYNRTWEARQIWGAILNGSRAWGVMARDFPDDPAATRLLLYRHFAWLTALRYSMREPRSWESMRKVYQAEYQAHVFSIPERDTPLETAIRPYLSDDELPRIMAARNKAAQILSLQSTTLRERADSGGLSDLRFIELERQIRDFYDCQGRSERIKNFPYPRQFSTINAILVRLFCVLLPFSMLREFDKLNEFVKGPLQGYMVWLVVPFSVLLSWAFTTLDQVGESTENPFEGSANDVPITQISRTIEIDLREMLGETDLPPAITAKNNIVL